jgi:hypothetical protein
MARNDWVAVVTDPNAEYVAWVELGRFGLRPYLPQGRRRWRTPHHKMLLRRYPLFPRYLLLPCREARHAAIRICRGVCKFKPILGDAEGRLWRAPDAVIAAVRESEDRGDFDEILAKGDQVRFTQGVLTSITGVLVSTGRNGCRAEVLAPLLGGSKILVPQEHVVRA